MIYILFQVFSWIKLTTFSYVLSRGTSRTLPLPWKIFDHKSTAGRLENKSTGQTPTEGLSTSQTNFWQFRRTFWGKKVRLAAQPAFGQPRKNLKYSIFECIKWHYILNVAYCYIHDGFLPLSPKKSKNASESDVVVLRNSKIEHVLPYKSLTKQDIALRFGQLLL